MDDEHISTDEAAAALQILVDGQLERADLLNDYPTEALHDESDEETDSACPILDSFYHAGRSEGILTMINFNIREFNQFYEVVRTTMHDAFVRGRGRKTPYKPKDILFMTLTVLKHGGTWDHSARIFKIATTCFERLVTKAIISISGPVYDKLVFAELDKLTMTSVVEGGRTFRHFPCARYATDVTFQQSYRPSGSMQEGKKFFSGKHKLYGLKVEVSVCATGIALFCSDHAPGSVADIDIFYRNLDLHQAALKKLPNEKEFVDVGPQLEQYGDYWAVLLDKGYQGVMECVRGIHPKKKPQHGNLNLDDERRNKDISSDRILVENYFGRLCNLWNILSAKYKWSGQLYDHIFCLCLGLTNSHIKIHPLRREDLHFYQQIKNKNYKIGESIASKRKATQQRYRARRRSRMDAQFRAMHQSDEEDTQGPPVYQDEEDTVQRSSGLATTRNGHH